MKRSRRGWKFKWNSREENSSADSLFQVCFTCLSDLFSSPKFFTRPEDLAIYSMKMNVAEIFCWSLHKYSHYSLILSSISYGYSNLRVSDLTVKNYVREWEYKLLHAVLNLFLLQYSSLGSLRPVYSSIKFRHWHLPFQLPPLRRICYSRGIICESGSIFS